LSDLLTLVAAKYVISETFFCWLASRENMSDKSFVNNLITECGAHEMHYDDDGHFCQSPHQL